MSLLGEDFQLDTTDDEEEYQTLVDRAEVQRITGPPGTSRVVIKPKLSDIDKLDRERRDEVHRARWDLRSRKGELQKVDERRVRGDQRRKTVTPQQALGLAQEGKSDILDPYRREGGFDLGSPTMTTSWVNNVAFDATIISDTRPIYLKKIHAKNFVAPSDSPVVSMLQDNGVSRESGHQYAVFSYLVKKRDALVHAFPTLVLDVDLVASFHGVVKDVSSLQLFRVNFEKIHPVLVDNASIGKMVSIPSAGVSVFKEAVSLEDGPVAEVTGPNVRYTFRFDPQREVRKWLLTHVDFWLKRSHLMGKKDDEQEVYWRAEMLVNENKVDPLRLEVFAIEDPGSNPLDPLFYLEVRMNADRRTGLSLPLERDQSLRMSLFVSTDLVPGERSPGVRATRWVELTELGVSEDNTNDLFREIVGRAGDPQLTVLRDRTPREVDQDERDFSSNVAGLSESEIEWRFINDLNPRSESLFAIDSVLLGPFLMSSITEVIKDRRNKV